MKIRNGFVSNSSSSSFVVAFPKKPTSVLDVKEQLFGKGYDDNEPYIFPFDEYIFSGGCVTIKDICEYVFEDIKNFELDEEDLLFIFKEKLSNKLFDASDPSSGRIKNYTGLNSDAKTYSFMNGSVSTDLINAFMDREQANLDLIDLENSFRRKELHDYSEENHDSFFVALDTFMKENEEYIELSKEARKKEKLYEEKLIECAKEDLKFFKKDTAGYFIFTREYSDHKRIESTIEHGQIFRRLPSVSISLH